MSADSEVISTEKNRLCTHGKPLCLYCLAEHDQDIDTLRTQLIEAEKIINIVDIDTRYTPTPFSTVMIWHGLINSYRKTYYPNPVDNPDNCLACMGATGFSVRHTCKRD